MGNGLLALARDFMIDFFGAVIPGILLALGLYVGIMYPIGLYSCEIHTIPGWVSGTIWTLGDVDATSPGIVLALVAIYVAGLSYSKRTLSFADNASFYYRMILRSEDSRKTPASLPDSAATVRWTLQCSSRWYRLGVHFSFWLWKSPQFASGRWPRGGHCIDFPYDNLPYYLRSIGLVATASQLEAKLHSSMARQTRGLEANWLNALKMRIEIALPGEYHAIAYLEAQNRLLAASYYVTTHVCIAISCFVVGVLPFAAWADPAHLADGTHAWIAAISVSTGLAFFLIQRRVLEVLHFERVREAVRVIDAAAVVGVFDVNERTVPTLGGLRRQASATSTEPP